MRILLDIEEASELMHFLMIELHEAFPQLAEFPSDFRPQSAINPVVQQHQLRRFL